MSTAPIGKSAPPRRVLRASAIRIQLDNRKLAKKQAARHQKWQDEAWDYFDEVPEVKNLTWFLGNAMSKLKLFVAVRPDDDPNASPIPASDPESGIPPALARRAQEELDRLRGPLGGRTEIQREANMNLEIAGECYLIGRGPRILWSDPQDTSKTVALPGGVAPPLGYVEVGIVPEEWDIKSTREVDVKGEGEYHVKEDPSSNQEGVKLDEHVDTIIRVYQRHPGASALADCHMRGVLSECELLTLLTNELKAESKSRQSAGFLTMPNELSYGSLQVGDDQVESDGEEEDTSDPFEQALMNSIVAPIEDPAAPESVYPLLLRGPAEYLTPEYLRHFSISRDTTQLIESRIEARVMRLARGLNAPVEATMGHQATTFANAFQINEDMYDDHLQPRVGLICDALTIGYLIPNLLDGMAGDPTLIERLIVWGDPSEIIKRTDPVEISPAALEAGAISWEAYRNYQGFSEDDAPDVAELLFRAILKISRPDPNLVDAIIGEVDPGLEVPPPVQVEQAQQADNTQAVHPNVTALRLLAELLRDPSRKQDVLAASARVARQEAAKPSRVLGSLDPPLRSKIVATADRALARLIEKAGNRLKAKGLQTNALLKSIAPTYAASTLGRELVAAAGLHDDELIGDDAWIALESQYRVWVADAQAKALNAASRIVTLTTARIADAQRQQRDDLDASWEWLADQLHTLAVARLYDPDPRAPDVGEFDPSVRIPAGMIRQALARAGGARNVEPVHRLRAAAGISVEVPTFVATDNGQPLGGIGTGALVTDLLSDGGAAVEGYEWTYGPAYRAHPFEEHEALDGETFLNFDDPILEAGDWIGDYYFPGDHDGCVCDFTPTWVMPDELASDTEALTGETATGEPLPDEPIVERDDTPAGRTKGSKR